MNWNWQQPDWPSFSWDQRRLSQVEQAFLKGGGLILGKIAHLEAGESDSLIAETVTVEAMTTSEIEGEFLDRDSVQSSIRRQFGLAADATRARSAEEGIAEMMGDLYHGAADPLDDDSLYRWHEQVMRGRRDVRDVGRYRTHPEPMQVVSAALTDPTVHFEAPPSARVPGEMNAFLDWFGTTAPAGTHPLPAVTRAGLSHLYFVSIHPFEDGNGRIARAISEKALEQGLGDPTLTALSATLLAHRGEYYAQLEAANKRNEVTPWLAWFAGITLEAQRRTQALVDFILDKTRLLTRLGDQLNPRQQKALLRMCREGPAGFQGGLSAGNYVSITGAATATATRDLADLVEKGALVRTGERRGTRYHLSIKTGHVPRVTVAPNGQIEQADQPVGL